MLAATWTQLCSNTAWVYTINRERWWNAHLTMTIKYMCNDVLLD